jgi:hypothetical protein
MLELRFKDYVDEVPILRLKGTLVAYRYIEKPVEPAKAKQEVKKPVVLTVENDFVLLDDLPIGGNCTFVPNTVFVVDFIIGAELIQKGDQITEVVTVGDLKFLPKGMKVLKGTKLTLPPGGSLPKPPAPAPEPKRVQIGKRAVLEDKFDNDPKLQNAALKYALSKVAELEGRVGKVEKEIVEIKKKLSPEEKAQRLQKKPTGRYYWDSCSNVSRVTENGVWYDLGPATQHSNGTYYYAILAN